MFIYIVYNAKCKGNKRDEWADWLLKNLNDGSTINPVTEMQELMIKTYIFAINLIISIPQVTKILETFSTFWSTTLTPTIKTSFWEIHTFQYITMK